MDNPQLSKGEGIELERRSFPPTTCLVEVLTGRDEHGYYSVRIVATNEILRLKFEDQGTRGRDRDVLGKKIPVPEGVRWGAKTQPEECTSNFFKYWDHWSRRKLD